MTELKPKIVVVDDEPAIVELLTKYLSQKNPARRSGGYAVTSFTNPKEALEHLKTNEVDLMLTDFNMPEMNGIELIKATKELKPNLPVLIMTGTPNSDLTNEITKHGISDYLEKPIALNHLEKTIACLCRQTPSGDRPQDYL